MENNIPNLPDEWLNSIDESIRCGLIEILILSMLSTKDMYTYEIKLELSKRSAGEFQMRDGSLYGPMYKMLERGLISSKQVLVGEKRFRNYYHLEESGRQYLDFSVKKFYKIFGITDMIITECHGKDQTSDDKDQYD